MPSIFASHADFDQWFNVPMQQAMQKNQQINMSIVQQLHSILRPFILRRLKRDVEKQLPSKTEYIIKCPLSRRQRYLYDEFISKDDTKSKIHHQDFLGLMNVLMQLRKVCNHPNLFDARSVESPVFLTQLKYIVPTLCVLHSYARTIDKVSGVGLNLLQLELSGLSKLDYQRRNALSPTAMNLSSILQTNFMTTAKYRDHFSYKWKAIQVYQRNKNVTQNFEWNERRIQLESAVYGSALIRTFTLPHKDLISREFSDDIKLLSTTQDRIVEHREFINEFMVAPEPALALPLRFWMSRFSHQHEMLQEWVQSFTPNLKPFVRELHYLSVRKSLVFPNKKMFIYDCGKLNSMIQLLKQLQKDGHKALIFTQVSRSTVHVLSDELDE